MAGVNKVILIGNLGRDPEVRHLESGRAVTNFSVATSETYKNKQGEKVTDTQWHNVVLWTPLAEIAEKYLKKGNQVYIEGKLTSRSYQDKDGITKYITEVVGRDMTLLGGRNDQGGSDEPQMPSHTSNPAQTGQSVSEPAPPIEDETDDLPF